MEGDGSDLELSTDAMRVLLVGLPLGIHVTSGLFPTKRCLIEPGGVDGLGRLHE